MVNSFVPLTIKTLAAVPGRTLVIGDIHGCPEELEILIDTFGPEGGDRIIAVGDLINRGPDSRAVLDLARQWRIEPVLGNHEIRLLNAWMNGDPSVLKAKDRRSYNQLTGTDWSWIRTWPHVLHIPSRKQLVVHGGFLPDIPWKEQQPEVVTRIQVLDQLGLPAKRTQVPTGKPWAASWNGPEHVFYGHTPRPHPLNHPKATGLDTGCVYGYTLSAVVLPGHQVLRIHAARAYADD